MTIGPHVDSGVSETYGARAGSAYNAHVGCAWCCALLAFNRFVDLEHRAPRSGTLHSTSVCCDVFGTIVVQGQLRMKRHDFRGDAAFANPEVYELPEAEGYGHAIRLPAIPRCSRASAGRQRARPAVSMGRLHCHQHKPRCRADGDVL